MVIGVFADAPCEEADVVLEPGDCFATFSDGVSEALNAEDEEFGDGRLLKSIADMTDFEVEPRLKHVFESVSAFTAGAAQSDDVTAMIVGYRTLPPPPAPHSAVRRRPSPAAVISPAGRSARSSVRPRRGRPAAVW